MMRKGFFSLPLLLFSLLSSILFLSSLSSAKPYNITLPTREQCLYFSDDNGVAEVLRFNSTQGPVLLPNGTQIDPLQANQTSPDKGILINFIPNVGYLPVGLAIHSNVLYVASFRFIAAYNITNELEQLPHFLEFATLPYECISQGILAHGDVLYVSCQVGTFPMMKFSLAPETYG